MTEPLCAIEAVPESGMEAHVPVDDGKCYLMLFRRGEAIVGYHNVCPHQGYGLNIAPNRFFFTREGWLMCAHHGASFDVDTGRCVEGPCQGAALKPVKLEMHDGQVWLAGPLSEDA